jgi:competence protein ComEC
VNPDVRLLFPLFIVALALIATATAYVPDTLAVTFLDVGQGDAILVQAPNGRAMLVDAGESWAAPAVAAGLEAEGIDRLEYVVATHDHDDHIGGMVDVLPQVTVGQFVTNGVTASTWTATELRAYLSTHAIATREATAGDTLALDPANVTVTVLNPPPDPGTDQNEASVVLRLVFGTQSFLLAGDAGTTAEGWMLASGRPVAAQFLKAGHHGSGTATGAAFVGAVDPAIAVIEAGRFNPYNHPDQAVVKRLQDSGADVYSTAASRTVRITATRTGYEVDTVSGPELPVTVSGFSLPPTDPNFDGIFDDVNGNRRQDFADVVALFNQMDWIAANEPVGRFDFNGNGRMDFADVVRLFNNL